MWTAIKPKTSVREPTMFSHLPPKFFQSRIQRFKLHSYVTKYQLTEGAITSKVAIPKGNYSIQTQYLRYAVPCSIYSTVLCQRTRPQLCWETLTRTYLWDFMVIFVFVLLLLLLHILQRDLNHLISAISEFYADLRVAPGIIHTHISQWKDSLYFQWVRDQSPGASPPLRAIWQKKYHTASALGNPRSKGFSSYVLPKNHIEKNWKLTMSLRTATRHLYEEIKCILELWMS